MNVRNLYVHFPFCRRKCSYCVLYSRVGVSAIDRDAYVEGLASRLQTLAAQYPPPRTVYFGGGSPALCNLRPLGAVLKRVPAPVEFTVELHPLDVTEDKLLELRDLGVNRISMGVQSFEDRVLAAMGRGYSAGEAVRAFELVKRHFDNAGIDLIVGYPGEGEVKAGGERWRNSLALFCEMGMRHCSVYALQNERRLKDVPDDDTVMNCLREVGAVLDAMGLARYEISNYAVPGFECRHNLAVWRGEDYVGLGDGASGRVGLVRTLNFGGRNPKTERVTPERDEIERTIFRLRTREGIDASRHPEWRPILARFVSEGLLRPVSSGCSAEYATFCLTPRGAEVCDTILAELV